MALKFLPVSKLCFLFIILQKEDSKKTGKLSTAGLYFFGFPVYRFDHRVNSVNYLPYTLKLTSLFSSFDHHVLSFLPFTHRGLSQGIQRPDFLKGSMHSNRLRSLN